VTVDALSARASGANAPCASTPDVRSRLRSKRSDERRNSPCIQTIQTYATENEFENLSTVAVGDYQGGSMRHMALEEPRDRSHGRMKSWHRLYSSNQKLSIAICVFPFEGRRLGARLVGAHSYCVSLRVTRILCEVYNLTASPISPV
jgi:hypothetical protein